MKKVIKNNLQKYLFSRGLSITSAIDRATLLSLIEKLHPFCTDKDMIRLGADGDGGYLVPDDLDGIRACFSPGVGELSSFEQDCANLGMQVFLADKSVDSPAINNNNFHFIKKFIGPISNDEFITMNDWVNESIQDNDSDLLLQMDIEGHEYFSIMNISDTLLKRFRIIIIEFHELQNLWNSEFYDKASIVFQKLLQDHICVHIHPNNCCKIESSGGVEVPPVAEFTFVRKDRNIGRIDQTIFPHPLDSDCTNNEPSVLPKCWYSSVKNV